MRVDVVNETRQRVPRQRVGDVVRRAEQFFGFPPYVSVQLFLVTDPVMQRLNRQAFRKNRPTDVLAFPLHEIRSSQSGAPRPVKSSGLLQGLRKIPKDPDGILRLGDIVISLPTAARQARRLRRSLANELALLFAHGMLHLLGYDHARPREASRMEKLTARLLA